MNPAPIDILWIVVASGLVFLMQGGFLFLESGLTRSKNAINVATKNLTDLGVAVLVFWAFGFTWMFGPTQGGWIGGGDYYLAAIRENGTWFCAFFLFQVMFCATAATIVSGAVAERLRFVGYVLITLFISGVVYPLFGHLAWGGLYEGAPGWLAGRGFVDFAGSTVVHSVGGWVALAVLLIIGARTGRFPKGEAPKEILGSNLPAAILGTLLLFLGWFGFNGGSTLAFNADVPGIIVLTVLAGTSGFIIALVVSWIWKRKADVFLLMNGTLAGLVAITANCHAVSTLSSFIIGAVGSLLMMGALVLLERLRIDDAVGAVAVHGVAGAWGTIAVALFGNPEILGTGLTQWQQLQVQLQGVGLCFLWAFGVTYLFFLVVNQVFRLRVRIEDETLGLNVTEHGAATDILELASAMRNQAQTADLSLRAPVEPFTEAGQIAGVYNEVMESLEATTGKAELILKTSTDGIISIDQEGIVTSFNPAAERMFGYAAGEVLGKNIKMLMPSPYQEEHDNYLANYIRTGKSKILGRVVEVQATRKDGDTFPIELSIGESKVGDQSVFTGIIRDVTQRRKSESKLRQLSQAVEQSTTSILITDIQGNIEYVNPKFTEITGYTFEEVLGKNPRILKSSQTPPKIYEQMWTSILSGNEWHGEFINKKKNGEFYTESISISPIKNSKGEIVNFLGIKEDITAHKKLIQDLESTKNEAESSNRAKSQFLANMSHEIRTPMNAIVGFSQLLQNTSLNRAQKDYVSTINESSDLLLSLINDVLDLSKIESQKITLEEIDFNLESLMEGLLRIVRAKLKGKNIKFRYFYHPTVSQNYKGDPTRIRQVLLNILSNAVKFTHNGQIEVSVTQEKLLEVSGQPPKSMVHIKVKDTGIGISRDKIGEVFESFTQSDASTTRQYGGTGLGLSIARRLAKVMGGDIRASSKKGKGSEFIVSLQLEESPLAIEEPLMPLRHEELEGQKVLIVDDNGDSRQILETYCLEAKMKILFIASSADEALNFLKKTKSFPDVILSDIMMPVKDGYTFASKIKSSKRLKEVKLVTVTSDVMRGAAKKAQSYGFDAFLPKPFLRDELMNVIRTTLGDRRSKPDIITRHKANELSLKGFRILIAEDNPVNKKLMDILLRSLGCQPHLVEDGKEAVKQAKKNRYDICLMDLQMPVMGGIEATERIRKKKGPQFPIIALTAAVTPEDRKNAMKAGMNDFLAKPIQPSVLKGKLLHWLK